MGSCKSRRRSTSRCARTRRGRRRRRRSRPSSVEMLGERIEIPLVIGGREVRTGRHRQGGLPARPRPRPRHLPPGRRRRGAAGDRGGDAPPGTTGPRCPGRRARRSFSKAADLLAGPWRDTVNAATMLGQSKTVFQAEIDAACELIDFWRFNAALHAAALPRAAAARRPGIWNRLEYRPLEGFVFAVTPFNFTSIGGNLPTAPALMGNTVLWKPASTAVFSNYYVMQAARGRGPAAGRHQLRARPRRRGRRPGVRAPRLRRHPLHRLDRRPSTACGRRSASNMSQLQDLSADRGRDRRQGLRLRPSVGRRRGAGDGAGARRLRVPGAEVLGGLARLRAGARSGRGCASGCATSSSAIEHGHAARLPQLHGGGDRRALLRQHHGLHRHAPSERASAEIVRGGEGDDSRRLLRRADGGASPTIRASS